VRLPGSGGAAEIAILCERVLVISRLSKRAFVEHVDFVTSPGFLEGGASRDQLHVRGRGPEAVITDLGILRFDAQTHEMYLASLHPGATVEKVKENVGWDLKIAADLPTTDPPTEWELKLIREELDPQGLYSR
jgi:glutaconate CoA-transferase subunit B